MIDSLLPIRNSFFLGAYEQTLSAVSALSPADSTSDLARRLLFLRSLLAQGKYGEVIQNISQQDATKTPELNAMKILAGYFSANPSSSNATNSREACVNDMKQVLATIDVTAGLGNGSGVPVLAATLFYNEGLLEDALRILVTCPKDLECASFIVQIYLRMDRLDLAKKELATIKTWADDATLAQLVEAWVDVSSGGEQKYQDAYYIFEELASSKVATSKLLNGQAIARMQAGRFEDAEFALMESLNKGTQDPETLINLIACGHATGKPTHEYLAQVEI